jgi:hypothetical protein
MSENYEVPRPNERYDGDAVDSRVRQLLGALDPGVEDGGYWLRFQRSIMQRAAGELARRRAMAELTVADLVSSWARAVVPTALLAAAVAGLLLIELPGSGVRDAGGESMLGVEEVLAEGMEGNRIPSVLSDESLPASGVVFAAEIF